MKEDRRLLGIRPPCVDNLDERHLVVQAEVEAEGAVISDCHVAFSNAAGPSPSITTYLYSYVSSAWIGVVTVHTFPSVHTIGNAAEMSQSFHVPTMATRWPGRVSTAISNLTGMSMSPDL